MVLHLTLKGLSIAELLLLQAGSQPWTSTSNSDQVFFIDGVANIENFDNFADFDGAAFDSLPPGNLNLSFS